MSSALSSRDCGSCTIATGRFSSTASPSSKRCIGAAAFLQRHDQPHDGDGQDDRVCAWLRTLAPSRLAQLSTVGALAYCSYTMCRSPVVPLFARDLGASPAAVFGTIYDIGDALGPICGGLVVARAGYGAAFHLAGAMAAVIALVFRYAARDWQSPRAVPVSPTM